jgi:alcohol dehydrogenase class IV
MTDVRMDEPRKPGRPRKFGQGRINATVRFTQERYRDLKAAADVSGRSVSEEVEARIEKLTALAWENEFRRDLGEIGHELRDIAQELLAKALARIDDLEKRQAINEEMIERAVLRALTKTRLTIGDDA